MSYNESDISWQVLRRIVRDWAGESAELAEVRPLDGGMINTTLCLTLGDGAHAVLKISPHRVNRDYEREAHQLDLLRSLGIPCPAIYLSRVGSLDDPHSFILMQFIEGVDLNEAKQQCSAQQFDRLQEDLARIVTTMHDSVSSRYCRVMPGGGDIFQSWPEFFRHIYNPMVKEIEQNNELTPKTRKQISKVHEKLDRLIANDDQPRLVHWDIWSTNLLSKCDEATGKWQISAVLDPNCKYAHAEAEIAYMDLFHTCTPAFTKAYQQSHKLDDGYHRVRKPMYQLYSMIDHVNLFGHDYIKPMIELLDKVSAMA
jgi:fructosamine-3-kinase